MVEDLIYGRAQDESFQTTYVKLKFQFLKGAGD
jgi:hypothetical protein